MKEIDIEVVKKSLQNSALTEGELKALDRVLPKLSPAVLEFLYNQSTTTSFSILSHAIFRVIFDSLDAIEELKSGDSELAIKYIQNSLESPAYQFGKWIIPLVEDVKKLGTTGKITIAPDLDAAILNFEIGMFRFLPEFLLNDLILNHTLESISRIDLLLEFQRSYATKQYAIGDGWIKNLLNVILKNEQTLGQSSIVVDDKKLPPAIKNWIKDYTSSAKHTSSTGDTFEEVQYTRASPNAARLTIKEKETLLKIIKLYNWLTNPVVDEEQIQKYESQLEEAQAVKEPGYGRIALVDEDPDDQLQQIEVQSVLKKNFPVTPQPVVAQLVTNKKTLSDSESAVIEKKLQDLKKRIIEE